MTLYTLAESNIRKTWLYLFFFFLLIISLGWLLSHFFENQLIFWLFFIFAIFTNFFSYWYSDKVVLSLVKAKKIEKRDNPELYRLVENLAITAGLPLPEIYIIDEAQPNAFATGRDPQHSVIAVTQGLLEKLERTELEGVISHELAHIGNRDILLSTIVIILVGLVIRITDFFFRMAFWQERGRRKGGGFFVLIAFFLVILAPILAILLKFAISRKREFLADASGALLTRYPEGLARALEKISADSNPLKVANDATAHLFIVNPFRGREKNSWLHKIFSTHPPIEERIAALRGLKI